MSKWQDAKEAFGLILDHGPDEDEYIKCGKKAGRGSIGNVNHVIQMQQQWQKPLW